jgi:uncharacterized protein (DUF488 family)
MGILITGEGNRDIVNGSCLDPEMSPPSGGEARASDIRPRGQLDLFTIGYEGRTAESMRDTLSARGIRLLVDVREVPLSRKPGFSKNSLMSMMESHGIQYVHVRNLGSPKQTREEFKRTGDLRSFFDSYGRHLALMKEDIESLARMASEKPTVIMCLERDASKCHRSIIGSKMREIGFEITDL